MTFDGPTLGAVLREFAQKRQKYEQDALARTQEVYEKLPRIAEIDGELRSTVFEVIKSTFSSGKDPAPVIGALRERNLALQRERSELLAHAGYTFDYMQPHYDCHECSDSGYVNGVPCRCLMRAYNLYAHSELCQRFGGKLCEFDDFNLDYYSKAPIEGLGISAYEQMEEVYNFCAEYSKHFNTASENLFMTGGSGLGKTMLASCIANEVIRGGNTVVYENAYSLFSAFEDEKFGRETDGEGTRKYRNCDLLILDDIGTEMSTALTASVFYNLINTRLLSGKKTIIISNLSLSEMHKRYGSSIYSRLSGDYLSLMFYGSDIRVAKRGI